MWIARQRFDLTDVSFIIIGCFVCYKCSVYVVVAMVQIEEAVKCIIVMLRFRSKKWVKNVIDDLSITTEEIE